MYTNAQEIQQLPLTSALCSIHSNPTHFSPRTNQAGKPLQIACVRVWFDLNAPTKQLSAAGVHLSSELMVGGWPRIRSATMRPNTTLP